MGAINESHHLLFEFVSQESIAASTPSYRVVLDSEGYLLSSARNDMVFHMDCYYYYYAWPVWRNGRAFTRDPKGRGFESRNGILHARWLTVTQSRASNRLLLINARYFKYVTTLFIDSSAHELFPWLMHDMLHTAYNSSFKQYLFGIVNHCLRLSGIRWRTDTLTRMKRVRRMVKRVTRNVTLRHRLMPSSDKKCCLQCRLDQLLLRRIVACSIVQKHAVFHIFLSLSVTLGIECWFKPFVWLFTYLDIYLFRSQHLSTW